MANQAQKTPFAVSFNAAAQQQALDAIAQLGKTLPVSVVAVDGWIVTVSFQVQGQSSLPNVTCPVANSRWIREPVQIGDTGIVVPADVALGGISGLGAGTPMLQSPIGNLSALVFVPVGNASWTPDDPGKAQISGPTGVILRTADKAVTFTLNETTVSVVGSGSALALVTAAFVEFMNTHTHPSNGAPPSQTMGSAQLTTVLMGE
jgi:hypothetical protein